MDDEKQPAIIVCHPLTFGGVAAFGSSSFSKLFLYALIISLLCAAAIVAFVETAWLPVVSDAIAVLPEGNAIRRGGLEWAGSKRAVRLADSPFLSFTVEPGDKSDLGQTSDLQVELAAKEIRLRGLIGQIAYPYPEEWAVALTRLDLEPWLGAWKPAILLGLGVGTVVWLFVVWFALATLYCLLPFTIAFFTDRKLTLAGAWRLSFASLFPGALLFCASIILYNFLRLRLIELCGAALLHVALGWIFVILAPLRLPLIQSRPASLRRNPFKSASGGKP